MLAACGFAAVVLVFVVYHVCALCGCFLCVCVRFSARLSSCVGNRKANSVRSNLTSSLKFCLGRKTDSDNLITAGRIMETEITGGILSHYSV